VQRAQVTAAAGRLDAVLHALRDVARARAEDRHAGVRGQLPQHVHVREARGAVVEHDRGRREQHAEQEVPHHPAGRREPEDAVVGVRVEVQVLLLELLEQDPALALDDRLRQAGRAGRVEDPEGVGEGDTVERQVRRVPAGREELRPRDRPVERRVRVEVGQQHGRAQARHLRAQPVHDLAPVERSAVVAVAVDREQHGRLDLREAVHHAARSEVRRAARPHRPDRRAREHRGDRLGDVRQVGDDAISPRDALGAQPGRDPRAQRAQLAPRQLRQLAPLAGVADRDLRRVTLAEDVLGVVERDVGEPLRARHLAAAEHALRRAVGLHVEEVPDRAPEGADVVDRPAPQLGVGAELAAEARLQPALVAHEPGALDGLGRRRPQDRGRGRAGAARRVHAAAPAFSSRSQ
jgi:hypothetical protein